MRADPAAAADADDGASAGGAARVAGDQRGAAPHVPDDAATSADGAVDAAAAPAQGARGGREGPLAHPLVQEFLQDPTGWSIWTAVAILRWMMADTPSLSRLVYRSRPSLSFSGSEVHDVGVTDEGFDLVLEAPGLAAPGSALPLPDIARIVADWHREGGGGLAYWLDGMVDRLMQTVELSEARTNAAFALATGGDLRVVDSVLRLAGLSAPLRAEPGGVLRDSLGDAGGTPVPALARMFTGVATAAGLEALAEAFTELPADVEEFVSVPMPVAEPARVGERLGRLAIGRDATVGTAGVNLVLDGAGAPEAIEWARDPERADSLAALCEAYVGGPVPQVFLYVDVAPEHIPGAALDGATAFGRAPLLGRAEDTTRIPIEAFAPDAGRP